MVLSMEGNVGQARSAKGYDDTNGKDDNDGKRNQDRSDDSDGKWDNTEGYFS